MRRFIVPAATSAAVVEPRLTGSASGRQIVRMCLDGKHCASKVNPTQMTESVNAG